MQNFLMVFYGTVFNKYFIPATFFDRSSAVSYDFSSKVRFENLTLHDFSKVAVVVFSSNLLKIPVVAKISV